MKKNVMSDFAKQIEEMVSLAEFWMHLMRALPEMAPAIVEATKRSPEFAQRILERVGKKWMQSGRSNLVLSPADKEFIVQAQKEVATLPLSRSSHRISRPPGSVLGRFCEFFFAHSTRERILGPILSDIYVEYCEALKAQRRAKAVYVRLRGYWAFWKAVGFYTLLKTVADIWRKVIST